MQLPTAEANLTAIRQALDLLAVPGGMVEIRALDVPVKHGKPIIVAGYYSDLAAAAEAAAELDSRKPAGVYIVLNEINPSLLARSPNQLTDRPKATTSDGDIIRRRWLPIDFDPKRPAGISATEDEHCAAEDVARQCASCLDSLGWPAPILADSGNGAHLLYRLDLPNDEASTATVKGVLAAVAAKFGGHDVDVDQTVFNAARIWKLYGTTARKGHDMPDRPHRTAQLIDAPEPVEVVPVELLQALIDMAAKPEAPKSSTSDPFTSRLDVPAWLSARGVTFKVKDRPDSHGRTVYLITCPFDSNHGAAGDTAIYQAPNGQLGAACKHNSCAGRGWQEFKQAIGPPAPEHWNPPLGDYHGNGAATAIPAEREKTPLIKIWNATDLIDAYPNMRPVVVNGLVRAGETMNVISASKVGKSWLMYGLALCTVTGQPWFDTFDTIGGRVLLLDNELHAETLSRRLTAVSAAMGLGDAWKSMLDVVVLRGKLIDLYGLQRAIRGIKKDSYSLVIADSWYRFFPPKMSENDNAEIAQLYNTVDQYCDHLGSAAWTNIHHSSKGEQASKAVTDVGSGAGSQSRAADTHLVLRPHEEEGVVVAEAAVRSFPPMEPICLRWEYPLWLPEPTADPRKLRQPKPRQDHQREITDMEDAVTVAGAIQKYGKATATRIRALTGFFDGKVKRILRRWSEMEIWIARKLQ